MRGSRRARPIDDLRTCPARSWARVLLLVLGVAGVRGETTGAGVRAPARWVGSSNSTCFFTYQQADSQAHPSFRCWRLLATVARLRTPP